MTLATWVLRSEMPPHRSAGRRMALGGLVRLAPRWSAIVPLVLVGALALGLLVVALSWAPTVVAHAPPERPTVVGVHDAEVEALVALSPAIRAFRGTLLVQGLLFVAVAVVLASTGAPRTPGRPRVFLPPPPPGLRGRSRLHAYLN